MSNQPLPENADEPMVDRGFTYRVTVASLVVGLIAAAVAALILFGIARPISLSEQGEVNWSIRGLLLPAGALVVGGILFWSIFNLPVRIARRRGVLLDPEVWPWTGALIAGAVAALGFVAAILLGII